MRRVASQADSDLAEAAPRAPVSEHVRRLLRAKLSNKPYSAEAAASYFFVDRRTLHRYLKKERTTFRQVANEVRLEIATELLADPGLSCSEIARLLQFTDPSAFTRAFRRWSGKTPSEWARAARKEKPARSRKSP